MDTDTTAQTAEAREALDGREVGYNSVPEDIADANWDSIADILDAGHDDGLKSFDDEVSQIRQDEPKTAPKETKEATEPVDQAEVSRLATMQKELADISSKDYADEIAGLKNRFSVPTLKSLMEENDDDVDVVAAKHDAAKEERDSTINRIIDNKKQEARDEVLIKEFPEFDKKSENYNKDLDKAAKEAFEQFRSPEYARVGGKEEVLSSNSKYDFYKLIRETHNTALEEGKRLGMLQANDSRQRRADRARASEAQPHSNQSQERDDSFDQLAKDVWSVDLESDIL